MILDILVIAVVLVSALIAFLRGFIREMLTIAGTLGGMAAAWWGGPLLRPSMQNFLGVGAGGEKEKLLGLISYPVLADILAYGFIFLAVVIVLSVLSHIIAEAARSIGLGALDRTLGVVFGVVRGIVLLGLLYLPFHILLDPQTKSDWFGASKALIYVESTSEFLMGLAPSGTFEDLQKKAQEAGEKADTTRDKLEDIDLLKSNGLAPGALPPVSPERLDAAGDMLEQQGYPPEYREKMQELFQEEAPSPHEGLNE